MMECSMCNYRWCWICGFSEDSCFHKSQFGIALGCQLFNLISFGMFEGSDDDNQFAACYGKLHWTLRFLFSLLFFATAPVIFFVGFTVSFLYGVCDNGCFSTVVKSMWKCCCILSIPFIIVWPVFLIAVSITGSALIVALCIVPFYFFVILILVRMIFVWCLCSKKGRMKLQDEASAETDIDQLLMDNKTTNQTALRSNILNRHEEKMRNSVSQSLLSET